MGCPFDYCWTVEKECQRCEERAEALAEARADG